MEPFQQFRVRNSNLNKNENLNIASRSCILSNIVTLLELPYKINKSNAVLVQNLNVISNNLKSSLKFRKIFVNLHNF